MPAPPEEPIPPRAIRHVWLGLALYAVFATADTLLTLHGTQGDLALEGNPVMQFMMATFGPVAGLVLEKLLVAVLATLLAFAVLRGIHAERPWVYWLALTPLTRRWMRRRRRYWIAHLPLYLAALAQGLAALSWYYLVFHVAAG